MHCNQNSNHLKPRSHIDSSRRECLLRKRSTSLNSPQDPWKSPSSLRFQAWVSKFTRIQIHSEFILNIDIEQKMYINKPKKNFEKIESKHRQQKNKKKKFFHFVNPKKSLLLEHSTNSSSDQTENENSTSVDLIESIISSEQGGLNADGSPIQLAESFAISDSGENNIQELDNFEEEDQKMNQVNNEDEKILRLISQIEKNLTALGEIRLREILREIKISFDYCKFVNFEHFRMSFIESEIGKKINEECFEEIFKEVKKFNFK